MLFEWHLSPEYILDNWTDMQIEAFWNARSHRVQETARVFREANAPKEPGSPSKRVSDTELFGLMGISPGAA